MRFDPDELDEWRRRSHSGKLRVLLIGINSYGSNLASLSFAVKDCKKIKKVIEDITQGFHPIVNALYGDDESVVTIEAVNQSLSHLLAGVTTRDTILFVFSGHGVLDSHSQELYLCLSKTDLNSLPSTGLSIRNILNRLTESGASKQVVILDACHSGAATRSKGDGVSDSDFTEPTNSVTSNPQFISNLEESLKQYVQQDDSNKHFHAFLSCSKGEQSYEDLKKLKHGIFSYYLIEGLSGQAADNQGWIHADRLWDYVSVNTRSYSKKLNVSQTPRHFKEASEEVILGVVKKESSDIEDLDSSGYGDTLPSDIYGRRWWKELKQHYPLSPRRLTELRQFVKELFLLPEEVERIETETIQRFEGQLRAYQQQASHHLHQHYPHPDDPFVELRTKIGFDPRVLQSSEDEAKQTFQEHKQRYCDTFLAMLCDRGEISPEDRQQLERLRQEYEFAPEVVTQFEVEGKREFERRKAEYQQFFFEIIHQYNGIDRSVLQQKQQDLGLGDEVVKCIEEPVAREFEQKKVEYQNAVARIVRSQLHPDFSPLKALQHRLQLGDAIVERIQAEEMERGERDRQKYHKKLKEYLHHYLDFDVANYHRQQVEQHIDLGDQILDERDRFAITEFENHCQTYQQAFSQKIRTEEPLSPQAKRELKKLQEELDFFDHDRPNPIVERLQQQERDLCAQDQQVYLDHYTQALRTQGQIQPTDRDRLNRLQQQFGFSNSVIAQIIQPVEQKFEQDQTNYRQAVDQQLRNQGALTLELVQQLQQKYSLNDDITQSLNAKLRADFERDQQQYHDLLVSELNQKSSLTSAARQRLRKRQTDLKLGDEVCQRIEAQVKAQWDDERQRKEAYEQAFDRMIRRLNQLHDFVLDDHDRADLNQLQHELRLTDENITVIEAQTLQQYQSDIQQYQSGLKPVFFPLTAETIQVLDLQRVTLKLSSQIAHILEEQCLTERLTQYKQAFAEAVISQYPINSKTQKWLQKRQQKLGLGDELILPIHQQVQDYVAAIDTRLNAQ